MEIAGATQELKQGATVLIQNNAGMGERVEVREGGGH